MKGLRSLWQLVGQSRGQQSSSGDLELVDSFMLVVLLLSRCVRMVWSFLGWHPVLTGGGVGSIFYIFNVIISCKKSEAFQECSKCMKGRYFLLTINYTRKWTSELPHHECLHSLWSTWNCFCFGGSDMIFIIK